MKKPILKKYALKLFVFLPFFLFNCFISVFPLLGQTDKMSWQVIDSIFKNRNYPEVITLSDQILSKENDTHQKAIALLWKGRSEVRLGQFIPACATLQLSIQNFGSPSDSVLLLYKARALNDLGIAQNRLNEAEKSLLSFQKALEIRLQVLGNKHTDVAGSYNNISNYYLDKGSVDKAMDYIQKAIDIRIPIYGENHISLSNSYHKLGQLYYQKGRLKLASSYMEKALSIRKATYGNNHPKVASSLALLGAIYKRQGAFERSLNYYKQSLAINLKNKGLSHIGTITDRNNIGVIYIELNELDSGYHYLSTSLKQVNSVFEKELDHHASTYTNLGIIEEKRKNYKAAFDLQNKSIKIITEIQGKDSPFLIDSYHNLGVIFHNQNKWQEAIPYYQKALNIGHKLYGTDHRLIARSYDEIASCYNQQHNFSEALSYSQKAEDALFESNEKPNFEQALSLEELSAIYLNRAITYHDAWYNTKAEKYLLTALATIKKANEIIKFRRNTYKELASQNRMSEDTKKIGELGLKLVNIYQQIKPADENIQLALDFMESSKIQQLLTALQTSKDQLSFIGLPDSLIAQLETKQIDLREHEHQLFEQSNDSLKQVLQRKIFEKKETYFRLLESLEKNYPDYFNLKYNSKTISLTDAQKLLPNKNSALIEYFIGDSSIYSLVLTQTEIFWNKHDGSVDTKEVVLAYLKLLQDYKQPVDKLNEKANLLTSHLLEQPLANLGANINQLLIIPDDILGYLPFEVLPLPSKQAVNSSYLLEKFRISYAYSGTLLSKQQSARKIKNKKLFAGFAPDYVNLAKNDLANFENQDINNLVRSGNYHLPGAINEVREISKLLNGAAYIGEQATESVLKQQANHYQILHLSMHSLFNDQVPMYSKLLFSTTVDSIEDGYLYASELYNLNLEADLVVLSACNTGFGKIQRGEGIMSLSRAFTYAGVPSTVMTLWKVPDKTTAEIMVSFYKYLKAEQTKDAALRQAKLDYLENTLEPDERHPYYWAGFVAAGDMRPITMERTISRWWLGGLFLVLLGGAAWFWRRN